MMYLNSIKECKSLLREVLEIWPKNSGTDHRIEMHLLEGYTSRDFDHSDFVNKIDALGKVLIEREMNSSMELEFEDKNGYPHKAVFINEDGPQWKLLSLRFQCPLCFGTGENDDDECLACRGNGWGV